MLPSQRVIPSAAWATAVIIFILGFLIVGAVLYQTEAPIPARIVAPVILPLALAGYTVLIGYVYGDARRRGMRYVMWTLLAIFLVNGIGIILYFILREPLLAYCSRCGAGVQHAFAFCPHCGAGVLPACPSCRRVIQPGWGHCAWCGANFSTTSAGPQTSVTPT
jgi:predicted RNA-binding Zn-ribbon protein involved in translation (DUF1610 family)